MVAPWWGRRKRPHHRLWAAVAALLLLHAAVLFAGFLAPYGYADQHRDFPYAPPARVHFIDAGGRFRARPFVYGLAPDGAGGYREDATRAYPLRLGFHGRLLGVDAPGAVFLLGTDGYGRDVFSRLLYGGRISLATGLAATLISLGLALVLGAAAGFSGGWFDALLMRGGELVMALPWLYVLLAARAFLPLHIGALESFLLLVTIVGGIGWVRPARLIRGVALSARERGYVQAARGFGASNAYLLRRHVLPETYGVALTQATVLIPQFILAEVTLSFLGLGIGEPLPSWGNMLAEARQYHALVAHAWMLAPAFATIPILFAYSALADALTRLDPH